MRTRLSTEERRRQLLAIGAELFASRPYEQVWIEEVAEIAQVSRGLLYHYFATKKDFYAAVVRTEADRLLRLTEPDPALPLAEQLAAGLDAYLDYAREHRLGFQLMHNTAIPADEDIRAAHEEAVARQCARLLDALRQRMPVDEATRIAVAGWLRFVATVSLDWLDHPEVDRAQIRDICARALLAAANLPSA
ncbi:TetR/AcrR family transcriptional regulator [Fodinicola acaciae]|uniref:TetR/AcrR family transcriptional regulator n=1 Tax=Fodinicola acaciae TaxID=2681555 RepID=UPI0013D423C8|nr:TetR/AcrR family transcriptional regulator [Fodinicola acaciae]